MSDEVIKDCVKIECKTRQWNRTYLVKEYLSLSQDVLQLGQLQEVALEGFGVLIDLAQLIFEFLKRGLDKLQNYSRALGRVIQRVA